MKARQIQTRTSNAIELLKDGKTKKALAIFRTFRMGFSKSERRTIQIASETMNGFGGLYQSLGIDTDMEVRNAMSILKSKYLKE